MPIFSSRKVCLINPPTVDPREAGCFFPMALITLGGVLKELGVKAEIWDFDLYFKKVGNTTERHFRKLLRLGVEGAGTDVFGISAVCSNLPMALWIAREIKACRPDSLVILGGPQPSTTPRDILEQFDFVDVVVMGEGEVTLSEMVRAGFQRERLVEISGLAIRIGDDVQLNDRRPLVKNMDEFPFPDYSLLDLREYAAVDPGRRFLPPVEVGRGCPFNCTFCSTSVMWEREFRAKSPARILEEMRRVHEASGFRGFFLVHDNFTASRRFVSEFCDFMERENSMGFAWTASSRTDCLDLPLLERMHRVGLRGLFFGIETGSEKIQKVIKKNLRFDNFEPVLRRCKQLQLPVATTFIIGFPEETSEDMDTSVRLALQFKGLGMDTISFSKLIALTGTALYLEYAGRLDDFTTSSAISPQDYAIPFIQKIIQDHPGLFPSFYHIPHPAFAAEYLARFVEFANLLVKGPAKAAQSIIEALGIGATKLLELWNPWALEHEIPYDNFRLFSPDDFRKVFRKFLDDTVFRDGSEDSLIRHELSSAG